MIFKLIKSKKIGRLVTPQPKMKNSPWKNFPSNIFTSSTQFCVGNSSIVQVLVVRSHLGYSRSPLAGSMDSKIVTEFPFRKRARWNDHLWTSTCEGVEILNFH